VSFPTAIPVGTNFGISTAIIPYIACVGSSFSSNLERILSFERPLLPLLITLPRFLKVRNPKVNITICKLNVKGKGKAIPVTGRGGP
jgi:hypothetical protein